MQKLTDKSKQIRVPRGYISYSQFEMVNRSEDEYVRKYIHGEAARTSRYMEFGTSFAKVLEGADTNDDIVAMVKEMVPRYKHAEFEIESILKAKGREVKLFGKIDTYDDAPTHRFLDYKTGKVKWTQEKANKSEQLLFYNTMIWIQHRVVSESGIVWAETEDYTNPEEPEDIDVVFTGKVITFPVKHAHADVLKMMGKIFQTAERIEYLYERELGEVFG